MDSWFSRLYGRAQTLADAGTGVVIASEFRKVCLPRNPTTTTARRSATATTAIAAITARLPRPTLTLLTILSIAGSLSMMNQANASTVPMPGTDGRRFKRLHMLRFNQHDGQLHSV